MGDGDGDGGDGIGGEGTGFGEPAATPSANENDNGIGSSGLGGFGADGASLGGAFGGIAAAVATALGIAVTPAPPVDSTVIGLPPVEGVTAVTGFTNNSLAATTSLTGNLSVALNDPALGFAPNAGQSLGGLFDGPPAAPPATAPPATLGQTLQAIGQTVLGLLGIASGTPQGVIGGGMSISNGLSVLGQGVTSAPSTTPTGDFGFSGGDSASSFAITDGGIVGTSPVAATQPGGGVATSTSSTGGIASLGGALDGLLNSLVNGLSAGLQPRQSIRYGQPAQSAQSAPASIPPALLLAGAALFLVT